MSPAAGLDGMLAGQTQGKTRGRRISEETRCIQNRLCWSLKSSLLHSSSLSTFPGECLGSLAVRKIFWPRFRQPIKIRSPSGSWKLLEAVCISELEPTLRKGHVVPPGPRRQRGLPSVKDTISASPHACPGSVRPALPAAVTQRP